MEKGLGALRGAVGTPAQLRHLLRGYEEAGVDQIIFVSQAGRNRHEHICESLEYFAREVHPYFLEDRDRREAAKQEELAPYIEAAMARKRWMKPLADDEIPIVPPSQEREAFYRRD